MTLLRFRRDTAAAWSAANPVLGSGEPGFETDTSKLKIGDGSTAWTVLRYQSIGQLVAASNLSDLADDAIARTNLGLGTAAVANVGVTAGTVAAGNDSRINGSAQKANNLSDLASTVTARANLGLGGSATKNVGTAAGTVAAGDDSRFGTLSAGTAPVGSIIMYAAAGPPAGWLVCDGSSVLRATYPDLFAVIGIAYGTADGTHFNLPNLTNKFPYGNTANTGGGSSTHNHALSDNGFACVYIAAAGGANMHLRRLTSPSWNEVLTQTFPAGASVSSATQTLGTPLRGTTDNTTALPPYTGVTFLIKI